jgi:hypothetical protein
MRLISSDWEDEKSRLEMHRVAIKCFPVGDGHASVPSKNPKAFVLRDEEKGVVGYVVYLEEEKWIYEMAVLPEYCNEKRYGSIQLLNAMINHISEVGGEWIAQLRDRSSLIYMLLQAKRGVAQITYFDPVPDRMMTNGDHLYITIFKYAPVENRRQIAKENEKWIQLIEPKIREKDKNRQEAGRDYLNLLTIDPDSENLIIPPNIAGIRGVLPPNHRGLTGIFINSPIPPLVEWDSLEKMDQRKCKLHVPKGSALVYRKDFIWGEFELIIEVDENIIPETDDLKQLKYEVHNGYLEIQETSGCSFQLYDSNDKRVKQQIQLSLFDANGQIELPDDEVFAVIHSGNQIINQKIVRNWW